MKSLIYCKIVSPWGGLYLSLSGGINVFGSTSQIDKHQFTWK